MKWAGTTEKTYETADCLINWEAEMKEVDKAAAARAAMPKINPAAEAAKAREAAAKTKAAELMKKRARLQRLQKPHYTR